MAPRGAERDEKSHIRGEKLPQEEEKALEKCGNRRGIEKRSSASAMNCSKIERIIEKNRRVVSSRRFFFDYARIIERFMIS